MQKLNGMLFFALALAAGCAGLYPSPPEPVCARPESYKSVICETATKLALTPEQIDAMFLDAALAGVGAKMINAADLRAALTKTRQWVVERDILSIDGLTRYLVKQAEVDPALALLVSRRIGLINLPVLGIAPMTPYDKRLVLAGIDHQLDQLKWF